MMSDKRIINVWDPIIRIGHWTLVIAFFTAYFTGDDWMNQHTWAGYIIFAVIVIRIMWGFIGGQYARFTQFIYKPSTTFNYFKNLLARKPQHYIGHNPAGGAMVIALLICLLITTISGMKLYAVEENKGPIAAIQQIQSADLKTLTNMDVTQNYMVNEDDEEFWEEIHETFVNLTLLLVFLHIGGIMMSSIIDKENLIKAMFTGKKEIDDQFK
jgi:cytochrome b